MPADAPAAPVIPQDTSILGSQEDHRSMTFNLGKALDSIATKEKIKPTMREVPKVPENPDQTPVVKEKTAVAAEPVKEAAKDPIKEGAEPLAEPATETAEDAPEHLDAKAKVKWAEFRKIEKAYKTELPALQEQIKALQTQLQEKDSILPEVEKYKSRATELEEYQKATENELFLTRVQATKKYKDSVAGPMSSIQKQVEGFAQTNTLDANVIMDLLVRGDENALEEFAAELSPWKQRKIEAWYGDIQTIERAKSDIEANSKAAYEKAVQDEQSQWQQLTQKQQEARATAIKTVAPKLGDTLNALLPEGKRFDMDKISRELGNYDQWPEDYRVMGAAAAAFVPALVEEWKAERASTAEQLEKLKAENTKLRGGAAKIAGGAAPSATEQPKAPQDLTKVKETDWLKGMAQRASQSRFGVLPQ